MCLALGYPHPDYLLAVISSRQFAEWEAFDKIDPIGEIRADLRAGIIASTIANVHRDAKKKPKPYRPEEFMAYIDKEEPDLKQKAKALMDALQPKRPWE